jgi:nucleoside-diphosphate-sugar epimerase
MKLFVIGATGRTGREIVEQALARGHHVTAFVRSPQGVKSRNERRSREDAAPAMGFSLSRKAVAAFMLDAIEQKKHFQKIVGIAK